MRDVITPTRLLANLSVRLGARSALPRCDRHPGSFVRSYRAQGPNGPGAYPQCVPANGDQPHLLAWDRAEPAPEEEVREHTALSRSECDVLDDAARGMTIRESAASRFKASETVKSQRRSILLKLGARNMTQAVSIMRDYDQEPGHRSRR
jgi:DNA-binding NarL/FixJ family response regulator